MLATCTLSLELQKVICVWDVWAGLVPPLDVVLLRFKDKGKGFKFQEHGWGIIALLSMVKRTSRVHVECKQHYYPRLFMV